MGYAKGSVTKSAIIEGAAQVVLAKGFSGTLVDDVCEHLAITRGRLTHHFRTREQLVDAVAQYAFAFFSATVIAPLCDASLTPSGRIEASFAAIRRVYLELSGETRGCFIGHSAMEASTRNATMTSRLAAILSEWQEGLSATLAVGGVNAIDAREIALIAVAAIEGAILLARAGLNDAKLRATFDALERMLLQIMIS